MSRSYGGWIESLPVLLSSPLIQIAVDFERSDEDRLRWPSLAMWSVILRAVGVDCVAKRDLPRVSRLSRRAARAGAGAAEKLGWITTDGTTLCLTSRGREVAAWASERQAEAAKRYEALRGPLQEVVRGLELEHPHFPIGYGPADPSISGGPGVDWKPVPREGPSSADGLPIDALLSQALVGIALEHERQKNGSLALVANVIRHLPDRGMRIDRLPSSAYLSGLERHEVVTVKDGVVKPSWIGRRLRDRHEPLLEEIESRWRERLGADRVTALRTALEALDLDSPAAYYPLVQLHLGGWVDIPSRT